MEIGISSKINKLVSLFGVFACLYVLTSCTQKEVDFTQLQEREGVYYEINQDKPFSGMAFSKFENGQYQFKRHFKKGLDHGSFEQWFENGQLHMVEYFEQGVRTDDFQRFSAEGELLMEGTLKDNSAKIALYKNGKIKDEVWIAGTYECQSFGNLDFERDSLEKYEHKEYKVDTNLLIRHTLLKQGTGFEKAWYPNGQLMWEYSYKEGNPVGTWLRYSTEGKVLEITPYDDEGLIHGKHITFHDNSASDTIGYLTYNHGTEVNSALFQISNGVNCKKRFVEYNEKGKKGTWELWNYDCSKRPDNTKLIGRWQMITNTMIYSYLNIYADGSIQLESKNLSGYSDVSDGSYSVYFDEQNQRQVFVRTTYHKYRNTTAEYEIGYFSESNLSLYGITSGYSSLEYKKVQ